MAHTHTHTNVHSQLTPWAVIAAAAIAVLSACGGSEDDKPPNTSTGTITKAQLDACPSESMSPVDMKKLGCLVGSYTGRVVDNKTQQFTTQTCGMAISDSGAAVLSLDGKPTASHQLSAQADTTASGNGAAGSVYGRMGPGFALKSQSDADGSRFAVTGGLTSPNAPWILITAYQPPGTSDPANAVVCSGSVS